MRSTSRTLHNSIFEPLYSQEEELHFQPITPLSDWLSHSPSSSASPSYEANMQSPPATIFTATAWSGQDSSPNWTTVEHVRCHESATGDHVILGMHSSSVSSSIMTTISTPSCPPSHSRSSSDVVDRDDGSVASKLLNSITKSMSSPSLLACCKESARETPYQKILKLRRMKLEHCAEELGSESSDGFVSDGEHRMSSLQKRSEAKARSMMVSVRSSPNLACTSSASKHARERSFPPPLTHTLPSSTSSDSFSYSLHACREDGRFVLKEVKVPCRQFFQASRKDGRLTLQRMTKDEDFGSGDEACTNYDQYRDSQEDDNTDVYQATVNVALLMEVESGDLVGQLEICEGKESKMSNHVGVDKSDERSNVEKIGCLNTKSLPMATLTNSFCGTSKHDKVTSVPSDLAFSKIKSDFKAAKRKSGKVARMRLSNQPLLSNSSQKLHRPIHLRSYTAPQWKLGSVVDGAKPSQCAVNSGSVGLLEGGKTLQEFEILSTSVRKSGNGVSKSASSRIMIKDVSAICLMQNVLATLGLHAGSWSWGELEVKSRGLEEHNCSGGGMESSMYNGMRSIMSAGEGEIDHCYLKPNGGVSVDVECERGFHRTAGDGTDVARGCLSSSSCYFDEQVASPNSNFQGKEWLQSLHCKEIFGRNQSFRKIHCVA